MEQLDQRGGCRRTSVDRGAGRMRRRSRTVLGGRLGVGRVAAGRQPGCRARRELVAGGRGHLLALAYGVTGAALLAAAHGGRRGIGTVVRGDRWRRVADRRSSTSVTSWRRVRPTGGGWATPGRGPSPWTAGLHRGPSCRGSSVPARRRSREPAVLVTGGLVGLTGVTAAFGGPAWPATASTWAVAVSAVAAIGVERFHQQLAVDAPNLHVTILDEDRVEASLTLTVPSNPPGSTKIWLASLPGDVHGQPLGESLKWTIAPLNVTPFIAVEQLPARGSGQSRAAASSRRSSPERSRSATRRRVLDPARKEQCCGTWSSSLGTQLRRAVRAARRGGRATVRPGHDARVGTADVAFFEPLVRATGRDEDALARVASLVEELRALPDGAELVPDGFDELWDVVWQVHQERSR